MAGESPREPQESIVIHRSYPPKRLKSKTELNWYPSGPSPPAGEGEDGPAREEDCAREAGGACEEEQALAAEGVQGGRAGSESGHSRDEDGGDPTGLRWVIWNGFMYVLLEYKREVN